MAPNAWYSAPTANAWPALASGSQSGTPCTPCPRRSAKNNAPPGRRHGRGKAEPGQVEPLLPLFATVTVTFMNHVTRILSAIQQGEPQAAEQLLPLVYDELRKLAA